jgi:hypothetical protein
VIRRNWWLVAAISIGALYTSQARPANINKKTINGIGIITIEGPVGAEDFSAFEALAGKSAEFSSGSTIVLLNNEGGNLIAGLQIGEAIRVGPKSFSDLTELSDHDADRGPA